MCTIAQATSALDRDNYLYGLQQCLSLHHEILLIVALVGVGVRVPLDHLFLVPGLLPLRAQVQGLVAIDELAKVAADSGRGCVISDNRDRRPDVTRALRRPECRLARLAPCVGSRSG